MCRSDRLGIVSCSKQQTHGQEEVVRRHANRRSHGDGQAFLEHMTFSRRRRIESSALGRTSREHRDGGFHLFYSAASLFSSFYCLWRKKMECACPSADESVVNPHLRAHASPPANEGKEQSPHRGATAEAC
ncbi:lipocalin [Anopheles sinensis]|uniref:Lipocalin n=1 Tax=Anopheles sinensis TaxID=74873 RepID=A0A084WKX9_ANOSI|nr:lipocalin [Anopheles sinensis]